MGRGQGVSPLSPLCRAVVRCLGGIRRDYKMGRGGGQTIHEVGEVDEVVAVLSEAVGEETTVVCFPAEDVGDHDDECFWGIGWRGDVGV